MVRRRGEPGATVVEAAFALPLLLFLIFGLLDLGMWVFNSNQATNAAKDGARSAIIQHVGADGKGVDEPYSIAWNRTVGRIESRLDRDLDASNVDIRCESPDGATKACTSATVDVDRVRVEVDWTWDLLTPVAEAIGVDEGVATGVATMTIIGKPVGTPRTVPPPSSTTSTTAPPTEPDPTADCVVSHAKAGNPVESNGTVKVKSNGQLLETIWVTFETNAADRCNGLAVQLTAPDGTLRSATCKTCSGTFHEWFYFDNNEKIWTPGTGEARIYNEWVPGVTKTFTLQT